MPRLRKHYDEVVRAKLIEQFGYKNVMEVPKIDKIVLNMGIGEATQDSKLVQVAAAELEKIAGQKVVITKSKQGHRPVQDPREPCDRRQGHAAQDADV